MSMNVLRCQKCKHYQQEWLFQICSHEKSSYMAGGIKDFHTIQHMRLDNGKCGRDMKLMESA